MMMCGGAPNDLLGYAMAKQKSEGQVIAEILADQALDKAVTTAYNHWKTTKRIGRDILVGLFFVACLWRDVAHVWWVYLAIFIVGYFTIPVLSWMSDKFISPKK